MYLKQAGDSIVCYRSVTMAHPRVIETDGMAYLRQQDSLPRNSFMWLTNWCLLWVRKSARLWCFPN